MQEFQRDFKKMFKHFRTKRGTFHAELTYTDVGKYAGKWVVRTWLGNSGFPLTGTNVKQKEFKKKSNALAFAKKYIKKHEY